MIGPSIGVLFIYPGNKQSIVLRDDLLRQS